jgi:hypothetical protein
MMEQTSNMHKTFILLERFQLMGLLGLGRTCMVSEKKTTYVDVYVPVRSKP